MVIYLDASALVKRYLSEPGSADVEALIQRAELVGTAIITRVEVTAALARATHAGVISARDAEEALEALNADWKHLIRVQVNELLVAEVASLAWARRLRGYDAVHLAAALTWSRALGEAMLVATYDRELWRGALASGLVPWPDALP